MHSLDSHARPLSPLPSIHESYILPELSRDRGKAERRDVEDLTLILLLRNCESSLGKLCSSSVESVG